MLLSALPYLPLGAQTTKPSLPFAGMEVVALRNGANPIDFDGDGVRDLVFDGWDENYNAHSHHLFTFYVSHRERSDAMPTWYFVPFDRANGVRESDAQ